MTVVLAGLAPNAVNAAITFSYVTDASSYQAAAGAQVTANVFLQEVVTSAPGPGGTTPTEIASPNGITGFGVYIAQTGSTGAASQLVSFSPNPQFTGTLGSGGLTGNQLDFAGNQPASQSTPPFNTNLGQPLTFVPGTGTNGGPGTYRIEVGTLTITAATSSGTTTFGITGTNNPNLLDPTTPGPQGQGNGPGGNDSTFDYVNGYDLDAGGIQQGFDVGTGTNSIITSFTVAVPSAVPEPGSMILTGLAGSVIGIGVWLRRRRVAVATSAAA